MDDGKATLKLVGRKKLGWLHLHKTSNKFLFYISKKIFGKWVGTWSGDASCQSKTIGQTNFLQ